MTIAAGTRLEGTFSPPGDKSVGHRLALLSAIAEGRSRVEGFPPGDDCARSLALVERLGARVTLRGATLEVEGVGLRGLQAPDGDLDAGNSGTTARIGCGLLAGQPFESRLVGDESLSRRPFDRVAVPLTRMGASIETTDGHLPVTIRGGRGLRGIDYRLPVPSAQVKTAVLVAGLYAEGETLVRETVRSRNHTEIALGRFGVPVRILEDGVAVRGGSRLAAGRFSVPGDFSSAAFFIAAAAALPGSHLRVDGVGLNPTRTALLDTLRDMGADITEMPSDAASDEEPVGRLEIRGRALHGTTVEADRLPAMIDEIPILAVVAARAEGLTLVRGASELRVKESDRLACIVEGLRALGADVEMLDDGFAVRGGRPLVAASLESRGDHRMVMAWAMASLGVPGACTIDHLDLVKISYPGFWETLERLVR